MPNGSDDTGNPGSSLEKFERKEAAESERPAAERREEILAESDRRGADISMQVLEKELEKARESREGAELERYVEALQEENRSINEIDLEKSIEEQEVAIGDLRTYGATLIVNMIEHGEEIPELSKLPDPNTVIDKVYEWRLNSREINALKKLREIGLAPGKKLSIEWRSQWKTIVRETREEHEHARGLEERIRTGRKPEEEDEPFYKDALSFVRKHPFRSAGIAVAGAVGVGLIYKVIKGFSIGEFFDKGAAGKAVDSVKYGVPAAAIGGALFMLGATWGPESWRRNLREFFGFEITPKRIGKWMLNWASEGFSWKALWDFSTFSEGIVETTDLDKTVAQKLDISAEQVALISEMNYKEFMAPGRELGEYLRETLPGIAESLGVGEWLELLEDETDIEAARKIRELLRTKSAKTVLTDMSPPPESVGEALEALGNAGLLKSRVEKRHAEAAEAATAVAATTGSETSPEGAPDEGGERPAADVETELPETELIGFGASTDELLKFAGEGSHIESTIMDLEFSEKGTTDKVIAIVKAAKDDGISIVSDPIGSAWGLVKKSTVGTYEWFTLTSGEVVFNAFYNVFLNDEVEGIEVPLEWLKDTAGFAVVLGATRVGIEYVRNSNSNKGISFAKGAIEGIEAPITVVKYHLFAAESLKLSAQEAILDRRIRAAYSAGDLELYRTLRVRQLQFFADQAEKYDSMVHEYERKIRTTEEGTIRRIGMRAWRWPHIERIMRLRKAYLESYFDEVKDITKKRDSGKWQGQRIIDRTDIVSEDRSRLADVMESINKKGRPFFEEYLKKEFSKATEARTAEIRALRESSTEGWERFNNTDVDRMLCERGIEPRTEEAGKFMEAWDHKMAEQDIRRLEAHGLELGTREATEYLERLDKGGEPGFGAEPFNPSETIDPEVIKEVRARPQTEFLRNGAEGAKIYRYMGLEIEVPAEVFEELDPKSTEFHEAIREHCSKKMRIPAMEVLDVEALSDATETQGKFRVETKAADGTVTEQVVELTPDEMKALPEEAAAFEEALKEKCRSKAGLAPGETIEVRPVYEGGYRVTTTGSDGTIIEEVVKAESIEGAKARFLDVYESQGKPTPPEFVEALATHVKWGWVGTLESVLGTTAAAAIMYVLLTSEDKEEAIVKCASIIESFWVGAKTFEGTAGRFSKNPLYHFIGNMTFGMAAVWGLENKLEVINERIVETLYMGEIGGEEFSFENADAQEAMSQLMAAQTGLRMLHPGLRTTVEWGMKKFGLETLRRVAMTGVERKYIQWTSRFLGKEVVWTILKKVGWKRGAAAGVMFLDDATVIGVADDLIAAGLAIWTVVDVIWLVSEISNAVQFQNEYDRRKDAKLEGINISDPEKEESLVEHLKDGGWTDKDIYAEGKISPVVLNEYSREQLLRWIGDTEIEWHHEGIETTEVWTIRGGEIVGVQYKDGNKVITSLDDETAATAEARADEMGATLEDSEVATAETAE